MSSAPLLRVEDLSVSFGTEQGQIDAVRNVSFEIGPNEVLGIVGESASGKSVTAMSIPWLLPAPPAFLKGGRILFDGSDVTTLSPAERRRLRGSEIGVVFQDPMTSLNPVRRIGGQLTEGMRLHLGLSRSAARKRAVELLTQVGIPSPEARLRAYPHELSGGMRQRVMIAIALACEPRLLIADEPTTALDVTIQAQIIDLVKEIADSREMAMIWITHDLSLLTDLADRTLVMYGGRIMEQAATRALYRATQHPYTAGLLGSIVDAETPRSVPLESIKGVPPDRGISTAGCPFAPRCDYAEERCHDEQPPVEAAAEGHEVACWVRPFAEARAS